MSKDELNMKLKIDDLKNQNQSYQEYIKYLEDKTDYYEDRTLDLLEVLDKIKEEYKKFNECDYNENNCEKLINKIKELLEEIE
ncbi:MAG: hypothetical protein IKR57_01790 [Bacilli bacterium]|nr:hypothetical protein [Bacilli bacterium]